MFIRLGTADGSQGQAFKVSTMNDTGSNVQTLYDDEYLALMTLSPHFSGTYPITVGLADGSTRPMFGVPLEVRLIDQAGDMLTEWIPEEGVLTNRGSPNLPPRLSGRGIRTRLFFATAPGNNKLYVTENKTSHFRMVPGRN